MESKLKRTHLILVLILSITGISLAQSESGNIWLNIYSHDFCTPANVHYGNLCYIQLGEGQPDWGRIESNVYFSVSYKDPPNVYWTSFVDNNDGAWYYYQPTTGYITTNLNTTTHEHILESDDFLENE